MCLCLQFGCLPKTVMVEKLKAAIEARKEDDDIAKVTTKDVQ